MNQEARNVSKPAAESRGSSSAVWVSVIMLTLITLFAFVNAAHDSLVFDDKAFVGSKRIAEYEQLADTFKRDVWGTAKFGSGLYRPLMMISLELQNRFFSEWPRGFHLVNIALHLATTLLLFGFLRRLLKQSGSTGKTLELGALVSALIFAVHPVHTEVVNSVFNGSAIYVSICAIAGLWWLFSRLETHPVSAWLGFGLAYSIGILYKESALVLPGIAVALIVLLTPGSLTERVRRFLPVFWLLLPIALYFYLRSQALAPEQSEAGLEMMLDATRLPGEESLLSALGSMGQALKVILWPRPLQLYYGVPSGTFLAWLIIAQALLLTAAIVLFFRGRPALAAGLAFFYVAYLPASRLISMDGAYPHLAERYLYFPSIGLSITLALALAALIKRFGTLPLVVTTMPVILLLAAVTWDRNHDWRSELLLFETEYQHGYRGANTVRLILFASQATEQTGRVAEICSENEEIMLERGKTALVCASAFQKSGGLEDAKRFFLAVAEMDDTWLEGRLMLGNLLIDTGQKQKGADEFVYIINRLEDPAQKELYKGILYIKLYPNSRSRLEEAQAYFEKALELDPELDAVELWMEQVDILMNPESLIAPEPQKD